MTGTFSIAYLSDHMELAPVLARWHREEWRDLMPEWTEADGLAELRSHTGRARVPTTLVALEAGGGALMGSVSLIVDDLEPWKGKYSPWLASLFVHPSFRGRGVGAELVRRLVDAAGEAGVRTLYVFAARSEAFYERLGWSTVERVEHHGYPSAIMAVPCRRESAREGLHSG